VAGGLGVVDDRHTVILLPRAVRVYFATGATNLRPWGRCRAQPRPMRRGILSERIMRCGIASDPGARHGAYYGLTRRAWGGRHEGEFAVRNCGSYHGLAAGVIHSVGGGHGLSCKQA
jgi:hypothetical protein